MRWEPLPGSESITYNRHVDATNLNNIFTLNPTTILSVRFGFNRFPNVILPLSNRLQSHHARAASL